jgi:Tfp pilus assembly protein PilO
MSAARPGTRALTVVGAPARPPATPGRAEAPALIRRLVVRLGDEWLPRAAWTLSRTGRPGLVGIALLLAAALFLLSTHLKVAAEVEAMRADLAAAQRQPRSAVADKVTESATAASALPERAEMPAVLHDLFDEVARARLTVDTAKYDLSAHGSGGVVRYQIAFPVTGPYPQVRAFIDSTLAKMPAVALSDLVLERKSIGSGSVDAQIRLTVHTAATGVTVREASDRVVAPTHAAALFAAHSWYVAPPPKPKPPPPAEPPPPEPVAPAFPYTFVGRFAAGGDTPAFSLARGDRLIDAHVGDLLDGVYKFESASEGELVFTYLPLNVHQTLTLGGSK